MIIIFSYAERILLKPLYTAFLHGIKLPGYRMRIKFDKDPLAV